MLQGRVIVEIPFARVAFPTNPDEFGSDVCPVFVLFGEKNSQEWDGRRRIFIIPGPVPSSEHNGVGK
jgi:hypothetical protein